MYELLWTVTVVGKKKITRGFLKLRRNKSEKSLPTDAGDEQLKIPVTNDECHLQLGALFNVLVIAIVFHSIQDLIPSKFK